MTNHHNILVDQDGYLGIAPCPKSLKEYSFAHKLLKFYQGKKFIEDAQDGSVSFSSLEWVTNLPKDNTGIINDVNGYLLLNADNYHDKRRYLRSGENI